MIVSARFRIAEDIPCVFGPVRCGIRGMHQARPQTQLRVDVRKCLVRPGVQFAHPADADQTDANVIVGAAITGHEFSCDDVP